MIRNICRRVLRPVRLALLLILFLPGPASSSLELQFMLAFNRHYAPMFRSFFGCGPDAKDITDCKPALGISDWNEFKKSCEAARTLFQLQGACK